jgi:glycosyltransferase AglI
LILASIIIPVFSDEDGLQVTLESIKQNIGNRKDIEIIVCNDGGGRHISEIAASYGAREVRLESNKGSYSARNRGIEASSGDILVFLDADQQITKNWLDEGIASLNDADYAGGQIKVALPGEPSIWDLFDHKTAFPVEEFLQTVHFAPTGNLFIKKFLIKNVGSFNESLRSGGDRDFGIRVFNQGFKQVYASKAVTIHPARGRMEQFIKLKRIARGYAELSLLVQNKNRPLFILHTLRKLIQVPVEMLWRFLRYAFFDYWREDKITFHFIVLRKIRKLVYFWYTMTRALKIIFL